jgi:hypothetical protein
MEYESPWFPTLRELADWLITQNGTGTQPVSGAAGYNYARMSGERSEYAPSTSGAAIWQPTTR